MATAATVTKTSNPEIDGLLGGVKWSGTITYSFADSPSDYVANYGSGEPAAVGFSQIPAAEQQAITYAIGLIGSYTNVTVQFSEPNSADIEVAQSSAANPTSYAYYPGNYAEGGDIWFGTASNYAQAAIGDYYFATAMHELGHAFGLKHSQETGGVANVAVPAAHDDLEYTVMSYRSYMGGPIMGYTNEAYGYSQTYMANDVLALQTLYGANFTNHSDDTVYSWSPTTGQEFINGSAQLAPGNNIGGSANRIFETIWDGNGIDTYDLSNYTTAVSINLNPGASSITSSTQLAYLGNGHYAAGNVYNAYLYNNDPRSFIENAFGGSGNDILIGNAIANVLDGGGGDDTFKGGAGDDTIVGGPGADVAVFSGAHTSYLVSYSSTTQTFTVADQRSGSPDGSDTLTGVENFQFSDGTFASSTFIVTPTVMELRGYTSLVEIGSNYFFDGVNTGSGIEFKYAGAAVAAGQFGGWAPIATEATASGYEVAWKLAGTNLYTVWNTDSSGNTTSNTAVLSATSAALESLEPSFHQDLNGDGSIGLPTTVVESFGSTSLTQVGDNFYLGALGPQLKSAGAAVMASQYGGWAPIATEATASGYEVAWKLAGTNLYTVWNTDSSGNTTSNTAVLSATSAALESLEPSFHQDLNSDGSIGIPAPAVGLSNFVTHHASVAVADNDTFVFNSSFGTGAVANAGGTGPIEFDGFPAVAKYADMASLFHDARAAPLQGLPDSVNSGYDTTVDAGHHESTTPTSFHIDLHASFIIR